MEKGRRVVSHLPEVHHSWVLGYPRATKHPESFLSPLWEQEEWDQGKPWRQGLPGISNCGGGGAAGSWSGKTSEHCGTGFWEQKTSNRMFKAALLFKGGILREARGALDTSHLFGELWFLHPIPAPRPGCHIHLQRRSQRGLFWESSGFWWLIGFVEA